MNNWSAKGGWEQRQAMKDAFHCVGHTILPGSTASYKEGYGRFGAVNRRRS